MSRTLASVAETALTISDLLTAARQAHTRYRQAAGRIDTHGKVSQEPRLTEAGSHVQAALSARLEAERLDPQRTDPAWAEDVINGVRVDHDAMVTFYAQYLTPLEARAQ